MDYIRASNVVLVDEHLLSTRYSRNFLCLPKIISRRRTMARMISMWTSMARGLFKTEESIATPCSEQQLGSE